MTELEMMPQLSPDREYTVIIICLEESVHGTAVKFVSDSSHDIYVVSRVPSFMPYLDSLLEKLVHLPKVRVLLVNHDPRVLVSVLKLLIHKSVPEHIQKRKDEYMTGYRANLTGTGGSNSSFQAKLPQGHADLPLAFDFAILADCSDNNELNHLSEAHVFAQQTLRFIALKHGVRYAAISGIEALIRDMNAMVSLSVRLFLDSFGSELVIYKPRGVFVTDDVLLHQFIPVGWDSWSKIILVAKSVPNNSNMSRLLTSEVQIGDLNDTYDDFFSGSVPAVVPCEGDREKLHILNSESKSGASLFQLLTIAAPQQAPPAGPAPLLHYREFLQSLQMSCRVELGWHDTKPYGLNFIHGLHKMELIPHVFLPSLLIASDLRWASMRAQIAASERRRTLAGIDPAISYVETQEII